MEINKYNIKEDDMLALVDYQRSLWTAPKLTTLFFELTDGCNLNCRHCGSRCSVINRTILDTGIIKKVLFEVAERYDPKSIMIAITGGEPILHPDCIEIIRYAHDFKFKIGMTSNGTLIDMDTARRLKKSGLNTISISIDGIGEAHDGLRMVKGSFNKAVEGILALKEAGIEPQVTTVVHKHNINELDKIYEFVVKNDIYSWRLTNVDPIGRALEDAEMLLDHDDMIRLFEFIKEKRFDPDNDIEVTYGCAHFVTFEYERNIRNFYFQCVAGTKAASVMANGDIGACLDIERRKTLVQGNAYKDNFIDIWENKFQFFRQNRSELSAKCSICEHRNVCMGDSAHTWDYDNNEPKYCLKVLEKDGGAYGL